MDNYIRFLGTHKQTAYAGTEDERTFYSHSFAFEGERHGQFSLASQYNKCKQVEPGSVFNLTGVVFEPAMDKAGQPVMTKRGEPVFNALRDEQASIRLEFIREGGFTIVGLPDDDDDDGDDDERSL